MYTLAGTWSLTAPRRNNNASIKFDGFYTWTNKLLPFSSDCNSPVFFLLICNLPTSHHRQKWADLILKLRLSSERMKWGSPTVSGFYRQQAHCPRMDQLAVESTKASHYTPQHSWKIASVTVHARKQTHFSHAGFHIVQQQKKKLHWKQNVLSSVIYAVTDLPPS